MIFQPINRGFQGLQTDIKPGRTFHLRGLFGRDFHFLYAFGRPETRGLQGKRKLLRKWAEINLKDRLDAGCGT